MILRYPQTTSSFTSNTTSTNNNSCNNLGCSLSSLLPTSSNNLHHHHHQNTDSSSIMLSEVSLHESSMNNDNSMMEEPCTPCSTWLSSLTSLHQLSLNTTTATTTTTCSTPSQQQFPSSSSSSSKFEFEQTDSASCTTINTTTSSHIMPPPSHSLINSSSSNNSARDVFEQEFQIRCNKHRKVNQATRDLSSLTPCSGTSVSPSNINVNMSTSECLVSAQTTPQSEQVNSTTAKIVSTVLSNVLSKSLELKQKKITKQRSGFKRMDMPKIIIPNELSGDNSSVYIKNCSLGKKK